MVTVAGSCHRRGRGLRRSRHSSLARTAACAGSPSSAAAEHVDRSGRPRCRRRGRLLIWTVAGRRMADSWSTPPPRPGWRRCGCTILRAARRANCAGHRRRGHARSGRPTWRGSDSSPAARSASLDLGERHDVRSRRCAVRPRRDLERATAISCSRRRRTAALMRRDARRIDRARSRRSTPARPRTRWPSFLPDGKHVIFLVTRVATVASRASGSRRSTIRLRASD